MTDKNTEQLKASFNLLIETEEVAQETLTELTRQKEILNKNKDYLKDVNKEIITANKPINSMLRRKDWCCIVV